MVANPKDRFSRDMAHFLNVFFCCSRAITESLMSTVSAEDDNDRDYEID